MLCPQCGKEMEVGYIYNYRRDTGILWHPGEKPPLFVSAKNVKRTGAIVLSKYSLKHSLGSRLKTYICRSCKTGMFNYDKYAPEEITLYDDFFSRQEQY